MKRMGFIWRESVYKKGFNCKCGNLLADPDTGTPKPYVKVDMATNTLFCDRCGWPVCFMGEMESDLPSGLQGDIEEWKKGGRK